MMKSHLEWSTEELLTQSQRNFSGHLAIIFSFLQQKGLSIDEFVEFIGAKASLRWTSVVTGMEDLLNAILLNVLANGEKVITAKIDRNWASATVTGLFKREVMEYYGCQAEIYDRFWNKFKKIADAAGFNLIWKKADNGYYEIELTR
jgi:hypothetical protein